MNDVYLKNSIDLKRARHLKKSDASGLVVYLMNRDQRTIDNHALSFAQSLALKEKQELVVLFILDSESKKYNNRQIPFMIQGLQQVAEDLEHFHINFQLLEGNTISILTEFLNSHKIGTVVLDFSPLKAEKAVKENLTSHFDVNIYEVDAHNIVPCWVASDKREFAAYTIRSKISKQLNIYSDKAIPVKKHPGNRKQNLHINWTALLNKYHSKEFTNMFESGEEAALNKLEQFIETKFDKYGNERNDPTKERQSDLSPYLHFGQISSGTILERVQMTQVHESTKEQFIDELIIRKELSDNYCYYAENYDSFEAFPNWAKESLDLHRIDKRPYTYTPEQFENSETDDELWNAAQNQMLLTGKMHGYMRMYWAKKILEWTNSPERAIETAIYLNDTYEIDGNDPNGYAGIAWSIGGVHDRAWFEREIYGKVRYMNYNGCKRKIDTQKYINQYTNIDRTNLL